MGSLLLIEATGPTQRVALVEHGATTEVMLEPRSGERLVGNIYKGRVVRVLPGMQSAFVEIGLGRTAFLFAGDLPRDARETDGSAAVPVPIDRRLAEGQDIIVQVAKEPMGTKGARVTSHITLPGRYLVYLPTVDHVGVSRRIADPDERDRLRAVAESIRPDEGGMIIRTAGEGYDRAEFAEDLGFLCRLWRDIQSRFDEAKPPALLHRDLELAQKAARDLLRPDYEAIYVDSAPEFARLAGFLDLYMPTCRPLLRLYQGEPSLFTRFGVEHELSRALGRKVWLKSGGYIVIDHTEALTAIDVNTGRYVGRTNFEDTILKINLEAVKEIAYQLRLRNIGGIIVIDFIDMAEPENRRSVREALIEALRTDRVRTNVLEMSALGLLEMTRKRVSESLTQQMAESCAHCEGRGWTIATHELVRQILAKVRDAVASRRDIQALDIEAHPRIVEALYEDHRETLEEIERHAGIEIAVLPGDPLQSEHFEVKVR